MFESSPRAVTATAHDERKKTMIDQELMDKFDKCYPGDYKIVVYSDWSGHIERYDVIAYHGIDQLFHFSDIKDLNSHLDGILLEIVTWQDERSYDRLQEVRHK